MIKTLKVITKRSKITKKHPTKYKEKPGLPNYKKRGSEFNLYYTSQSCKIKDGKIILSKDISIPIPQYEKYSDLIKDFKQIRIKPSSCGYKCELAGIEIVINEESYTSKCDSLAFEKIGKHENYLGKRRKRGLFQSSTGKLINADVNGALNIMRKVVGDSCESIRRIIDRGLLFNPVRITNVFC